MALFNYESEQIFEKVHGDNTPQGKHFVSDCKQELLNGLTPNYPQLSDYEQEWLYFGDKVYVEGQPVNLEYATFEGTKGQIGNAIPFNYKRAILNGLTLVSAYSRTSLHTDNWRIDNLSTPFEAYEKIYVVIDYEILTDTFNGTVATFKDDNGINMISMHHSDILNKGRKKTSVVLTTPGKVTKILPIWARDTESKAILHSIVVLKYHEGMENLEIPYFEGMKSFDNHLVTTTGKNLIDTTSMWFDGFASNSTPIKKSVSTKSLIVKVKPNTSYTFSRTQETNRCVISSFKGNYEDLPTTTMIYNDVSTSKNTVFFTTQNDVEYLIIYLHHEPTTPNGWIEHGIYQLEEGSTATPYEPYYEVESYPPVLTTSGKNLFDKSFILGNINSTGNIVQSTSNIISNAIKVKGDTTYSISRVSEFIANSKLYVIEYDENMNLIKTGLKTPFTTSSNCKYVRIQINGTTDIGTLNELMQIEEGPTATTYEPYQQHQVRINDDITLRSVGDTHDELNLLTGELTERIGEVVFDGSENWVEEATLEITQVFRYTPYLPIKGNNQIIYDTLPTGTTGDSERLVFDGSKTFYIAINKTKANTVDELKTWLQSNPITVQYVHATESVKSIEVNTPSPYEGTNYYTSTTPLVLECPVVSTGAKTLNEISQDE